MASSSEPRILVFKADGAIAKGSAVKIGSDKDHVAVSAATTDKHIGIAQNAAVTAQDKVEVAIPGGGAKGLCQASVSAGMQLTSHTDGKLKKAAAANDRIIAIAMQDGSASDLIAVEVQISQATAVES